MQNIVSFHTKVLTYHFWSNGHLKSLACIVSC